jgi:glycosyltransferase involved in cell wall biosynthesis
VGPRPSVADVVHAPTLLVPPVGRYRLVVTIHDAVPWTHPETLTKRGVNFHRRMAARAARAADVVVVPTQAVGHELERHLRLPPQGVTVVSPGPTSTLVRPPDEDERAVALGLPDGGYVVTLATFEPRKGLDVLFDAIAQPSAPDLPLVIVGRPGWGGVDPARQAAARGLVSGRVRVLTGLPDRDLSVVLSRATMAVVPSRAEGFGLPVLEAMSFGTPVITSDIPALAEVGSTATLRVPAQDSSALAAAMKQLADDPLLRSRLSSAGLHRAGQFSWKRSAATLWSAYRDLVPGVG